MSEPIEHEFEVWQDGTPVAIASSTDRGQAIREIRHYAAQYGQDGPVEIKEVTRRPLELPARSDEVGDARETIHDMSGTIHDIDGLIERLNHLQAARDAHVRATKEYNDRLTSERTAGYFPPRMGDLYQVMERAQSNWLSEAQRCADGRVLESAASSLSSYKQRVEELEKERDEYKADNERIGCGLCTEPDSDCSCWHGWKARTAALSSSLAEAREALEEIAAASKCQRRLATNMAAIEHIACSVLAALSKGGSDA